jgi:hypothetical protein
MTDQPLGQPAAPTPAVAPVVGPQMRDVLAVLST